MVPRVAGSARAGFGVLASFVLLMGASVLAIRESKRLSLGLLFKVCSGTMVVLAFILAGKGTHSLQEAGFVGVSTLSFWPRFDLIGMYPSLQTLAAQLAVAGLMFYLFVSEARAKRAVT